MKSLLTIIFLFAVTVNAQTLTVSGQKVYTQAAVDAAIKAAISAQAKIQANTDAVINSRLTALEVNDTVFFDKRYFLVVGRDVSLNIDSVSKYVKVPVQVVDLTSINNSIATLNTRVTGIETRLTAVEIRTTSLEQWRTVAQGSLDKINTTISLLPPIPTKAVSVSTSTTTTTTTTTLQ